jgi:hypothetical protein
MSVSSASGKSRAFVKTVLFESMASVSNPEPEQIGQFGPHSWQYRLRLVFLQHLKNAGSLLFEGVEVGHHAIGGK